MQSRQAASKQRVGKLAIIAPREEQSNSGTESNPPTPSLTDLPRTRLPPRSRSGCWTCRTRKVKCDEHRPRCNQCLRLGHRCDYSPKLAFKDETPKIVQKYLGPDGSSEWIPLLSRSPVRIFHSSENDHLPPFTDLVLEEDWQTKARYSYPGTFFIVANASSFESGTDQASSASSVEGDGSMKQEEGDTKYRNTIVDTSTLILGSFEETCQQMSTMQVVTAAGSGTTSPTLETPLTVTEHSSHFEYPVSPDFYRQLERNSLGGSQPQTHLDLWSHYRAVVRKYLLPVPGISLDIAVQVEDAFEREAKRFAPLEHALMAITALNLSREDNAKAVDALQYYDMALGPLRHEHDPASDGAFLTHFVLLLYEVAGNEPFWAYHMASLNSIIQTRRQTMPSEPYPYIIWCACLIDISAALSGSGQGEFIQTMATQGMGPSADEMLNCPAFLGSQPVFAEEANIFRALWDLQCSVYLVAAEIAESRVHRRAGNTDSLGPSPSPGLSPPEQSELRRLREMLHTTWTSRMTVDLLNAIREGTLSRYAQSILDAARVTYYSCIINTQRQMWPGSNTESSFEKELVSDAARSILEIAHGIVHSEHSEQRFIVLPLLLAATVLDKSECQNHIQRLMQRLASESLGSNTQATLKLLNAVHEQQRLRQQQQGLVEGCSRPVDLYIVQEMANIHVIHFGL